VIWDRDCLARCSRSPAILATEPAGDLHHYRRHESTEDVKRHKITPGGGGAFLHPTNGPKVDRITIGPEEAQVPFVWKAEFPTRQQSTRLTWRNLLFAYWNPYFGILPGVAYLLFAWSLAPALKSTWHATALTWGNVGAVCRQTLDGLMNTPWSLVWIGALIAGFIFFTDTHVRWYKWTAGTLHALAHLTLNLALAWFVARVMRPWQGLPLDSPGYIITSTVGLFMGGYLGGSLVMGCYLVGSLLGFGRHANEAFSSLRIEDYKNFLRWHIDASGRLTIYPFGIPRVPRHWRDAPHPGPSDPKLVPAGNKTIAVELIEEPIQVLPPWRARRGDGPGS
jgi:hypothetical protein